MKKKFLSILLALAMCLTLLPTAALAEDQTPVDYRYWDDNEEMKSGSCAEYTTVTSSTGNVTWGESGKTTWYVVDDTNPTISAPVTVAGEVYLILCDDAKLNVTGGLQANAALHICGQSAGTGELNVSGSIKISNDTIAAIYMNDSTLEVNGGKVTATGDESDSCYSSGIYITGASEKLAVNGGTLEATGGKVTTTVNLGSCGIYRNASSSTLKVNGGSLIARGGEATGENGNSYGISERGNGNSISIYGGTLEATGGTAAGNSYGIYTQTRIFVSGGTLEATGGQARDVSYGIYAQNSDPLTVRGTGELTAIGGEATGTERYQGVSYGILANSDLTVEGGKLTATGGTAAQESYGISISGDLTAEGGTLTATGGTAGTETITGKSYDIQANAALKVSGGTVQSDADGAPVLVGAKSAKSCNVTVSDGTIKLAENSVINEVTVRNVTLSSLLAEGCGFKITGGETVTWYDGSGTEPSLSNVTVQKLPITGVSVSANSGQTGDDSIVLSATVTQPAGKTETVAYQWYEIEDNNAAELTGKTSADCSLTEPSSGSHTYRVTATVDGYSKSGDITITVKATLTEDQYTAPTANTEPDYDGTTAYPLVTAGSFDSTATAADVKFKYRLGDSGDWTTEVPEASAPGTYKVYWYIDGGAGYNDIGSEDDPKVLTVTWTTAKVGTMAALRTAIANGWSPIQLTADIDLADWDSGYNDQLCGLFIGTGKDITLDLNGYLLTLTAANSSNSKVVLVKGGKLTLTDSRTNTTHTETTVKGGAILCTAEKSPTDGIVAVYADGTTKGSFTMKGGTLTGSVGYYGGVYVQGSDFTMTGGTITGCTGNSGGGGVYLTVGSTFTLNGGTISNCTAAQLGGGVYLTGGSTFTMKSGFITGCTATSKGGGVYVDSMGSEDSTFTMTDGTISGCKANQGGGVYTHSISTARGIFRMSGGSVTGCKVVRDAVTGDNGCGSGVYLNGDYSTVGISMYANGGTVADDVYVDFCRIGRDADGSDLDTYTTFSGKVEFQGSKAGADDAATLTVTFDPADGTPAPAEQKVLKGQKATAPANPAKSGHTFGGWYQGETQWSFDTAITEPLTLTAKWTASSSGGGSSSGGSSSGGSSSGSGSAGTPAAPTAPVTPVTPGTTVTVPVSSDKGSVNVKAEITETDGGAVTATVEISDKEIEQVAQHGSGTVTVDVSGLDVASATVPAHVVDTTNKAEETGLTVALPGGTVSLDNTALESVTTGQDITVSVQRVPATDLTAEQQKTVGDMATIALVVDVDLFVGSAKQSGFNGGKLTVSVPYTPKRGEDTSKLTVWFIRDDGTIENKGGYYDAAKGCFVFETEHLSRYVLVYSDRAVRFTDVPPTAYFAGAVAWAVQNGVTGGVTETAFAPYASCTRAQIVTFLYRYAVNAGLDVSVGEDTNILSYNDTLEIPEYAIPAFQWACGAGVMQGSDGNLMPNQTCTRAQAVAFLYRFAALAGLDVSVGEDTNILSYNDVFTVPEYAVPAFQWACGAGVMQGNDGNLMPNQTCTRAQIVTMLYRLLGE